jgi:hypothetical protein
MGGESRGQTGKDKGGSGNYTDRQQGEFFRTSRDSANPPHGLEMGVAYLNATASGRL